MNLATLTALLFLAAPLAAQETKPAAQPMALVVQVDCELARERVWMLAGSSDAEVVETAAAVVRKRCAALRARVVVRSNVEQSRLEVALPGVVNPRQRELAESLLRSLGLCEFFFVADPVSVRPHGIDLRTERSLLEAWKQTRPGSPLEFFNTLDAPKVGPHARISWISLDPGTPGAETRLGWPILLPGSLEEHFGAASFERTYLTQNSQGKPAIGYELRPSRRVDFERLLKERVGQRLAIVIEGRLISAHRVEAQLPSEGLIDGQFTLEEAQRLLEALQQLQSPLRILEIR